MVPHICRYWQMGEVPLTRITSLRVPILSVAKGGDFDFSPVRISRL